MTKSRTGIEQQDRVFAGWSGGPQTAHEPWLALSSAVEARLTYPTGYGLRSLPVRYVTRPEARELTLRLPEFNDAVHYVDGCDVTIEVSTAPTQGSEAVRVAGRAAIVADDRIHDSVAAGLEHWPPGVIARFIVISVPDAAVQQFPGLRDQGPERSGRMPRAATGGDCEASGKCNVTCSQGSST